MKCHKRIKHSIVRSSEQGIVSVLKDLLISFMNESSANGYPTTDNMAKSAQKFPTIKISHPRK